MMVNDGYTVLEPYYPLVMTNIAMENGTFIVDFPSYKPPFIGDQDLEPISVSLGIYRDIPGDSL